MRQDTCITSLEGLQRWFDLNQKSKEGPHPYFTIWRGNEARQDRLIHRNTEISDTDKAWEALEEIIDLHSESGGLFRVFITYKPSHNIGMTTLLKMPNTNPYGSNIQQSGIGSMIGGGMYGSIRELVEVETQKALELDRLKRRIEDMEADKEAAVGIEDRLLEKFFPVISRLAETLGMKAMGFGPSNIPSPAAPGIHNSDNTQSADGFDYDRLEPALDDLREIVPDVEGALEKLARMAKNNPDLARQFLQGLD